MTDFGKNDLDEIIDKVISILREGEKAIPVTSFKNNLKPYWCSDLDTLKKEKIKCFKEWCEKGRPRDPENPFKIANTNAKKSFNKCLKSLAKTYERNEINEAIRKSEIDRNAFWRLLKKKRTGKKSEISAIKDAKDVTVYEVDEILLTWKSHFSKLCTPKSDDRYDDDFLKYVDGCINEWMKMDDEDDFLKNDFNDLEIIKAIKDLNSNKAPGYDGVTKEHIVPAGNAIVQIIKVIMNGVKRLEYVPKNFRRGLQVPIYKGKNLSTLNTNNYRGITLLSVFNKLFEVLIWNRIQPWWNDGKVIESTQGACKKGLSSLHTAFLLQESIASNLETHRKVFVLYLDVSKAFDSVWINGLFYQLYHLGLKGKIWRILYLCYQNFKCKVRIQDKYSESYTMTCGIHQGGFLSLVKYVIFINSLLRTLIESNLCCSICQIKSTPVGYADDIAAASIAKNRIDEILKIVDKHSRKWRYDLNADKSAVLTFGETPHENKRNSAFRIFNLGAKRVKEKTTYDHVGVKACIAGYEQERTVEKVKKGRKVLNAAAGLGFKKGGLTMFTCNLIYWTVIVPTTIYGSELWILKQTDIDILDDFQRYAGRRIQRFPPRSPNETAFVGLGWMRLENYIYAKKLIFIRTILVRDNKCIYKQVFITRAISFNNDIAKGIENANDSLVYDILRLTILYDIYDDVMRMVMQSHMYTKSEWKKKVWARAWEVEDEDCRMRLILYKSLYYVEKANGPTRYFIWWAISDNFPWLMKDCENMVKILCKTSKLKCDDFNLTTFAQKSCTLCNVAAYENIDHLVMTCTYFDESRQIFFNELRSTPNNTGNIILDGTDPILELLLGKVHPFIDNVDMIPFWIISCRWISRIYQNILANRNGIG